MANPILKFSGDRSYMGLEYHVPALGSSGRIHRINPPVRQVDDSEDIFRELIAEVDPLLVLIFPFDDYILRHVPDRYRWFLDEEQVTILDLDDSIL